MRMALTNLGIELKKIRKHSDSCDLSQLADFLFVLLPTKGPVNGLEL